MHKLITLEYGVGKNMHLDSVIDPGPRIEGLFNNIWNDYDKLDNTTFGSGLWCLIFQINQPLL